MAGPAELVPRCLVGLAAPSVVARWGCLVAREPITEMSVVNSWLALMRVHEGVIRYKDSVYYHGDDRVPDYLANELSSLTASGYLALSNPDPKGVCAVCVTHKGQLRYQELNECE